MCRCEAVYFRRSSLPRLWEIALQHKQLLAHVRAVLAQVMTQKVVFLIFATERLKSPLTAISQNEI
jgi:hypothetical protein